MYQDFSITTIAPSLQDKQVYVNFSMDVDPVTVNDANIEIYDRATRNTVKCGYSVNGKEVQVTLDSWPIPNIEYIIVIQNIKDVLGDDLSSGARRIIMFNSVITSGLKITYPAYDEVITNLLVKWEEVLQEPSATPVGSYHIQISSENSFYNIIKDTTVVGSLQIDISDIVDGQYYVRGRVEKDGQYGAWSEVITFIIGNEPAIPAPIVDPTPPAGSDPIFDGGIQILKTPEQGATPTSFVIEFDHSIDPSSLTNITIVRRSI
jgi:hypothetical protein